MKSIIIILLVAISMTEISAFPVQKSENPERGSQAIRSHAIADFEADVKVEASTNSGVNTKHATTITENLTPNTENLTPNTEQQPKRTTMNGIAKKSQEEVPKRRFRRSFGYKTQCIPEEKVKCKVFNVDGMVKNFCIMHTELSCTALD